MLGTRQRAAGPWPSHALSLHVFARDRRLVRPEFIDITWISSTRKASAKS